MKCKHCGAPITGFWAKISALAGVRQSLRKPEYCNKCEDVAEHDETVKKDLTEVKSEEPKDLYEAPASSSAGKKTEEVKSETGTQQAREEKWAEELRAAEDHDHSQAGAGGQS